VATLTRGTTASGPTSMGEEWRGEEMGEWRQHDSIWGAMGSDGRAESADWGKRSWG
jgi:hypothetical protein